MTFRELLAEMSSFAADNPAHESLDRQVVVRFGVVDDDDDDEHVGGLQSMAIDSGCTDSFALVLDADQDGDDGDDGEALSSEHSAETYLEDAA
jgi:hypothetical protein